jgi:hypothetical protein
VRGAVSIHAPSIALHQSAACPCGLAARYPYGFFISGIHGTGFSEHDDGERATGFRRVASRSFALCFWALDVDTPELRQAVSRAEPSVGPAARRLSAPAACNPRPVRLPAASPGDADEFSVAWLNDRVQRLRAAGWPNLPSRSVA